MNLCLNVGYASYEHVQPLEVLIKEQEKAVGFLHGGM